MAEEFTKIGISDVGTQLFKFDSTEKKFVYLVPVKAGAEFSGDTESTDAPETDLDYVPKIKGRTTFGDIEYTVNYTKEKYKILYDLYNSTDDDDIDTFMEVLSDGTAMVFQGAVGMPSITGDSVKESSVTIVCSFMQWIEDIDSLTETEANVLNALKLQGSSGDDIFEKDAAIPVDADTIPTQRKKYAVS